tara:strand:+ start:1536 stop:2177 length:642 start_codon:yes stop_codon:yes gene_type:complete
MLIRKRIINKNIHKSYILASSSKSRFKILQNAGIRFKQVKPLCNEDEIKKNILSKSPIVFVKKLSFEKAKSVSMSKKYFNKLTIGCDTIVYFDKKIFDKASNIKEAKYKIMKLSGKKHKIVSGLTVCYKGKKIWQCSETTEITIRNLTKKQIDNYLKDAGSQILQSVGCYQIEGIGPQIIENIKGDFFNVMGLPLFKLLKYLEKQNEKILCSR